MKHFFCFCFCFCFLLATAIVFGQAPQANSGQAVTAFQPGLTTAATHTNPSRNGSGSLGNIYSTTACGLNYVSVSKRVGTRFSPAGSGTPTTLVVAGIPAGAIIVKSFLWYGGTSSSDDPDFTINSTNYTATVIGTGADLCWSYPGSINFRGDVTASITGNGTYNVDLDEPDYDVNGMTLMVIYRDVFATYSGSISINDGLISVSGGNASTTVPIPPPGCNTTVARGFGIFVDLQNNSFSCTFNGSAATGSWDWWNYLQTNTSFTTGATSSAMNFSDPGDCYDFAMAGVYYQTQCSTPPTLSYTATQSASCAPCAGSVTVTPSGSAGPFNYSWAPAATAGNVPTATGLCNGTYTVVISDANLCSTVTGTVTFAALTATSAQTNIACNGACNGSATVTASGGTAPLNYAWAPSGGTAATASGLCAGSYTCTVTDAASCSVTQTVTITQPALITATASQTDVSCNGSCNGTATVTPSGGTPGYTYSWAPSGGTGATASGLCAGTYTCTIRDANTCSITKTVTITQPAVLTATISSTNLSCNSVCNGTATVTPSGGTAAYTYSWAPSGGSAATATSLCAGTYTCTITDAHSCSITKTTSITEPAALTATTVKTDLGCNGVCNGTATVTPAGGTLAYTYSWAPSGGAGAAAGSLCAGTYTCTITDANSCSITQTAAITQPPALTATITNTNVSCNALCNGTATVIPAGGTLAYTYSWAPSGGTGATAGSLCAATYTCTITDAASCSITKTAAVTQPAALTATATQTDVACNGACNGTATVTPSGGTAAYTYAWAPSGGSAATAGSLCAGSYTCTVTDANSCSITKIITITEPAVLAASITKTDLACNSVCNGTATVTASGGTLAYTYAWAPSGGTGATATSLCAGTYTCTITDAASCSMTQTATITEPAALTATALHTDLGCNNICNGTATVTPAGGTLAYTYSWSPSGGTGAAAGSLCAGTYTCTISDANSCSITQTATITQPAAITVSAAKTDVSCNGACNGAATVTATGGAGGYTYSWAPLGGTGATASSLCAGTYTCTITDANSCSTTQTIIITEPAVLAASTTHTDLSCNGVCNGTATVTPAGGTAGYTYAWAPSGGTGATAGSLCAGTYTCTITDSHSCVLTQTAVIAEPAALTAAIAAVNVSCNAACNGTAAVTAAGGTAGYAYSWAASGGTAATASSLCAGTYTCTITDANGCSLTQTAIITEPPALTAGSTLVNVSCNAACNGSATVTPAGGAPGYAYSWAPSGGTGATATGLCAGTYTCTVTDANGCTAAQIIAITEPAALAAAMSQTNVSCNGVCDGTATAVVSGGTAGYTYAWSPSGGTAATATGLCAGNYTLSITDANGCVLTQVIAITQNSTLTATATQTNVSCNGVCDGTSAITVSGGTPGYAYAWAPSGGTAASATALCAGSYTCTVTDTNGCTLPQIVTITEPVALSATVTQTSVSCNAACDGTASVLISGGTPGYTYSWAPAGGTAANTTGLCAGTYTCTVTDANGCTLTQAVTITEPPVLTAAATQTNVSCNAACNGSVTVTASGGTPGYTYSWLPSGGTAATANSLCAGTYTCTISDAKGCSVTQTIIITEPAALTATATQANVSCNAACNGTATVTATGGTLAYTYAWAPSGGIAATASGLCAGTYTCTVTDANACTVTQTLTITEPAALTATAAQSNVSCNAACNGTATVTATGGTLAYAYAWAPLGGSAATATNLCAGTYTCTITDANACPATQTVTITEPPALAAITTHTNVACNAACNGTAATTVSGGTAGYTYSWLPSGGTGATATGLCAGTYTCTITDANGCSITQVVVITEPAALSAGISTSVVTCAGGTNGTAAGTATGGTLPYTYAWSNGGTLAGTGNLPAGPVQLVVTDSNACTVTATAVVTENPAVVIFVNNDSACVGQSAVLTASGTASYIWNTDSTLSSATGASVTATPAVTTTYTVIGTNTNGCTDTAYSTVTVFTVPVISVSGVNTVCAGSATLLTASGATTYSWLPSAGLTSPAGAATSATPLVTTTYTVTGTSAAGCSDSATYPVTVNPRPVVTATGDSVCRGASATLTASGAALYGWGPATGLSSTSGAAVTATVAATAVYTVIGTDANGCLDSATATATILPLPVISVNSPSLCAGLQVNLNASGAGTYSWSPGTNLSSVTGATVAAHPAVTSSYTVTGTNAQGCSATATSTVTLLPLPQVAISGDTVACLGDVLTLNAATNAATLLWSTGESTASVTFAPAASGNYSVTATNSCGSQADNVFVLVHALPTANAGPDVTIGLGNSTTLSGSGGVTYMWLPVNGLSCSQCANPVASPEHTTEYVLTTADVNGCSFSDTVTVIVDEETTVFVPDIFSPDGDGHNDLFTVAGSGIGSLDLHIYDRWGQMVFNGSGEHSVAWDGTFKGALLNNGVFVYTLYITYLDGKTETKKGNLTLKK